MIAKTTCIQPFTWYLVVLITQIVSVLLCNMLEGVPLFLIKILWNQERYSTIGWLSVNLNHSFLSAIEQQT
jgi:hypothetical protein